MTGGPVSHRMPRARRSRSRGALWGNPEFLKLWAGQSASVVGDQISGLAIPLVAVLVLDASATEMGLLTAMVWLPHLLFSLGAGLYVDRRARRLRIMVATDLLRAATLASIPVAYWLDALTIEHLLGVAFVVGALTVFFDVAWSTFFMRVVSRTDVVEANAKLSVSRSMSFVVGPPAAGGLVQVLGAAAAVLADALSFVVSALFLRSIRVDEPALPPPNGESVATRLAGGFRFLFGHPLLRAQLGCSATINLFNLAFYAIVVLFMAKELDLSAGAIGLILGVGALGGLAGTAVAPAIGRRIGIGPAVMVGAVLFPLPLLLFPLAAGPEPVVWAMLTVGEFLSGAGVMIYDIHANSLIFLLTPEEMRPRQSATYRFVNYGVRPIGAFGGGLLAAAIGLRPALLVVAAFTLLGVPWLVRSPTPRLREVSAG
jgi:MFS family permease